MRRAESECPFCSAAIVAGPEPILDRRRLPRAALMALGPAARSVSTPVYGAAGDVAFDAGVPKRPDAGHAAADASAERATCPSATDISASNLPWGRAAYPQASCTDDEVAKVEQFELAHPLIWRPAHADERQQLQLVVASLSETCARCIEPPDTRSGWGPIPLGEQGYVITLNVGGCLADDECGRAFQNVTTVSGKRAPSAKTTRRSGNA